MAIGLMQHAAYATNDELDREEAEIFDSARGLQENRTTVLPSNLAAHVDVCWNAAYQARATSGIDEIMLQCMRAREGIYDPEDMAEIEATGGSQIFMMLTDNKCVAFEAWTRDVMLPPGEKPWTIEPTEWPDLPDEIEAMIGQQVMNEAAALMMRYGPAMVTNQVVAMRLEELRRKVMLQQRQYAEVVTARFEDKIEDDYQEGGFYTAIDQFISDLATFPAAFIKGPCMKRRKALVWQPDRSGGSSIPVIQDTIRKEYQRVSALDCYPSPSSRGVNDGYFIERMRLRLQEIQSLTGMEGSGYKDEEIRAVLQEAEGGAGGFSLAVPTDQSRQELEGRNEWNDPEGIIDCLNYWGHVQGVKLLEWGMDRAKVPDPDLYYHSNIWKIGTHVIMARINPHPLGEVPYYSSSFRTKADSIWGKSPPMCMKSSQRAANGAARAMMNNAGIASGPQCEVDISRVDPALNPMSIYPWKIWQNNGKQGPTEGHAVQFFMPPLVVKDLLGIFQWASEQGSEESGIPNSIYGGQGKMGTGAADTFSGYAMITNAANKTLGGVVFHVDQNIMVPVTRNHWLHLMLYDDSMPKAGDINVVARASRFLIVAEQIQQRLAEFARTTNNPTDLQIMGIEGRAELLREMARFLRTKANKIIPDEEKLKARLMEQAGMVQEEPQNGKPKPGQKQIPEKAGPQTKPTAGRPRPEMEQQGGRGPSQGPGQRQGIQRPMQGNQRPMQAPQRMGET